MSSYTLSTGARALDLDTWMLSLLFAKAQQFYKEDPSVTAVITKQGNNHIELSDGNNRVLDTIEAGFHVPKNLLILTSKDDEGTISSLMAVID